jgi:transposase
MQYYTGLDVSMKTTSLCIVDVEGKIVFEETVPTDPGHIALVLNDTKFPITKVALESGSISNWLLKELKMQKIPAICIDSKKMSKVLSININKTDKNDAHMIAEALRCKFYSEVAEKSQENVDLGILLNSRRTLINIKNTFKNSIRGHLKAFGIRLGSLGHAKFILAVKKQLEDKTPHTKLAILELLKSFEFIAKQIDDIDKEIEKLATNNEDVQLLSTIDGIGPITALTYIAHLGDPNKFNNSRSVGAYFGLTPNQYSSGETVQMGRISKCGNTEVRNMLNEAAVSAMYRTKAWSKIKAWGLRLAKKKGHKKAAMAVARKFSVLMHRMLITRKPYERGTPKEKKIITVAA